MIGDFPYSFAFDVTGADCQHFSNNTLEMVGRVRLESVMV